MAKASATEEVWVNTNRGKVYVRKSAPRPGQPHATKEVALLGGAQIRLTTVERELYSDSVPNQKRDVFRNGTLKRLDKPTEDKPLDPEHQEEQALTEEELTALLEKNGNAFRSAIKKLDERNSFRLKVIVDDEESTATQAQRKAVTEHIEENFSAAHVSTFSKEIREEREELGD